MYESHAPENDSRKYSGERLMEALGVSAVVHKLNYFVLEETCLGDLHLTDLSSGNVPGMPSTSTLH